MKNPFRRRPAALGATPRADRTRIAVLEHDLFGVTPEPGTAAALAIAHRTVSPCTTHTPVEATTFSGPPTAYCTRCTSHMTLGPDGEWVIATAP